MIEINIGEKEEVDMPCFTSYRYCKIYHKIFKRFMFVDTSCSTK